MRTISTATIQELLKNHGKKLKNEKEFEIAAHQITLGYLDEMLESTIQPYMECPLIGLLGDVSEKLMRTHEEIMDEIKKTEQTIEQKEVELSSLKWKLTKLNLELVDQNDF